MVGVAPGVAPADRSRPTQPSIPVARSPEVDLPSPAPPGGGGRASPLGAKPALPKRAAPPPPHRGMPSISEPDPGEVDLPAPVHAQDFDLPSRAAPRNVFVPLGVDLPAIPKRTEQPAPRPSARAFGEIELDLPSPAAPSLQAGVVPSTDAGFAELPSPARTDLPDVRAVPSRTIDLPELAHELPSPISLDLPDVSGVGLPSSAGAGLPSLGGAGLPLVDDNRASRASLPASRQSESGRARPMLDSFGELDLPLMGQGRRSSPPKASTGDPSEADPFGEAVLSPPRSLSAPSPSGAPSAALDEIDLGGGPPLVRQQGGSTSYGEVNLSPGVEGEVPLDAPPQRSSLRSEEDMEFGGVPQGASAPPLVARAPAFERMGPPASVRPPRARGRTFLKVVVPVFVVLVGGAALALVPAVGPFGAYWAHDQLRAGEYEKLVDETVRKARKRLTSDTFSETEAALKDVAAARETGKRVRALAAYASYLGFARELRFGSDGQTHARAKILLEELNDAQGVPYADLALAGRAATEGQLARARQLLSGILQRSPKDPDALALKGEVELRAKDAKSAIAAWSGLGEIEQSARAAFGLSRARFAAGDLPGAEREAKQALTRNSRHLGAQIQIARIQASDREREASAVSALTDITSRPQKASPDELVMAYTLLGDIHLGRSRISRAEAAYTQALKLDPKVARALIGLGEALYRAGRYSEAQARFEAGAQADPDDVLANIGVAKSKLMLERLEEAHASLKKLRESHPNSVSGAYWYGRALEALGSREQAERAYREAIDKKTSDPLLVETYIALALLQNQQGRAEDAKETLQAARERLPSSSAIHRALGDVALARGRYADAESEFRLAITLDEEDLVARFKLGVALRRNGKFDEALRAFEAVKAIDREYPGLALEHGLLYEASGRTDEALKAYEGALAKAPEDPDLMLRVGCGYATAERTKEAQELLRKVLALRPTSAETNHCLGRALLSEGSRLADALRQFDRAVELDPHRAEYHLYVGWAANEAGNVPKAERALDTAIKLDQGLADAYWQRGVLRSRQGAVRDAISDLARALQLRPSRHEAHAALADAYYDFGKEALALGEWRKAVAARPENATWRFRYGKLLAANQMNEAARAELGAALSLAEKTSESERWLWEGHHLMARAIGQRPEAVRHWEQFLRLGPVDSPYRAEAKAALQKLGKPWSGN